LQCGISPRLTAALGQLRSSEDVRRTTALTLEADLAGSRRDVSDVPQAEIAKLNLSAITRFDALNLEIGVR
jgi:hypothetical protein